MPELKNAETPVAKYLILLRLGFSIKQISQRAEYQT